MSGEAEKDGQCAIDRHHGRIVEATDDRPELAA
jgi:hypothetical protein